MSEIENMFILSQKVILTELCAICLALNPSAFFMRMTNQVISHSCSMILHIAVLNMLTMRILFQANDLKWDAHVIEGHSCPRRLKPNDCEPLIFRLAG